MTKSADNAVAKVVEKLASARARRDAVYLKLAEDPGDEKLNEQAALLEDEVADQEKELHREKQVTAAMHRASTKLQQRETLKKLRAKRAAVPVIYRKLDSAYGDLVAGIRALGPISDHIGEIRSELKETIWGGIVKDAALSAKTRHQYAGLLSLASGAEASPVTAEALFEALGGRAPRAVIDYRVKIPEIRATQTVAEAIGNAEMRVLKKLDALIARYEAEVVNGEQPEPQPDQEDRFAKGGKAASEKKQRSIAAATDGDLAHG